MSGERAVQGADAPVPLLARAALPGGGPDVLLAATSLLDCVRRRFAPRAGWEAVIGRIVGHAQRSAAPPPVAWAPPVRASFGRDEPLPAHAEAGALYRLG